MQQFVRMKSAQNATSYITVGGNFLSRSAEAFPGNRRGSELCVIPLWSNDKYYDKDYDKYYDKYYALWKVLVYSVYNVYYTYMYCSKS